MSSLRLQVDLHQWFIQETFFVAVITGIVYAKVFDWKTTFTGKLFITLMTAIIGVLLHDVLIIWRILPPRNTGGWAQSLTWLSTISLGVFGVVVALLLWEGLRQAYSESGNKWVCKALHLGRKFSRDHGKH